MNECPIDEVIPPAPHHVRLVAEAVPPVWQLPLSDDERSLWRAMAGEHQFTKRMLQDAGRPDPDPEEGEGEDE